MALDFADRPETGSRDPCWWLDCTQPIERHKPPANPLGIPACVPRLAGKSSELNTVLALVSILSLKMLTTRIVPVRTAAGFAGEIHIRRESRATDILAH